MDDVVMQPRCIHCDTEHYCMNVLAISLGEAPCGKCGKLAPVFTSRAEYRAALQRIIVSPTAKWNGG